VERKRYNDAVRTYKIAIRSFPGNLFAGMFGFHGAAFFDAPAQAKAAPQVKF
jgi:LemA protein